MDAENEEYKSCEVCDLTWTQVVHISWEQIFLWLLLLHQRARAWRWSSGRVIANLKFSSSDLFQLLQYSPIVLADTSSKPGKGKCGYRRRLAGMIEESNLLTHLQYIL
jgi:hypothetical protein